MTNAEQSKRTGPITVEEARAIAARFRHAHFRTEGERPIASIPVDFARDSDVRMSAFITQAERAFAIVEAARRAVATQARVRAHRCPSHAWEIEAQLAADALDDAIVAFDEVRRG